VFFFFSSRRRHTRSKRDWSSDVCSSDLAAGGVLGVPALVPAGLRLPAFATSAGVALIAAVLARARTAHRTDPKSERRLRFWRGRSEERRVGKEGRGGWWAAPEKKKAEEV